MVNKTEDILTWSLTDLGKAIKNKKISPVEVTKLLLEEIDVKDKELNSYITVMADQGMKDAIEAEKDIQKGNYKGPLHGIPIAIKDDAYVKGVRNTNGSELDKDFIPDIDA